MIITRIKTNNDNNYNDKKWAINDSVCGKYHENVSIAALKSRQKMHFLLQMKTWDLKYWDNLLKDTKLIGVGIGTEPQTYQISVSSYIL